MEVLACQEIFSNAERGEIRMVWSFMHEDETILCPFPDRKIEVSRLASLCKIRLGPEDEIVRVAKSFQKKATLAPKDAIHLACASYCNAKFFLTCDEDLIKKSKRLKLGLTVLNPVDYVRQEVL